MKYEKPYLPIGFTHLNGEWNTGFTIEHQKTKSKFVWIPVAILPDIEERLSEAIVKEAINVTDQYYIRQMLMEYGGMYFSAYPILKTDRVKSVAAGEYWNLISFNQAKTEAVEMGKELSNSVTRLPYGWEYNAIADTIRMLKKVDILYSKEFKEFGLYDMDVMWFWTLQKYGVWSKVVKRGDPRTIDEEVYANSDYQGYKEIGFRVLLMPQ